MRPKPIRAIEPGKNPQANQRNESNNRIQDLLLRVGELISRRGTNEDERAEDLHPRGMAASDELHCTSAPTTDSNGRIISTDVTRGQK